MMGAKQRSFAPMTHKSLEELVPQDNLVLSTWERSCAKCEKSFMPTNIPTPEEKGFCFPSETVLECEAVMLHGQKSKIGEVFAQV